MSEAATLGVASLTTCGAGAAAAADFAAALRVRVELPAFAVPARAELDVRAVDFVVLAFAMMPLPPNCFRFVDTIPPYAHPQ
jgi:hypothetical protein